MAEEICVKDVKNVYPSPPVPDEVILDLIDSISAAIDACLDSNSVPASAQRLIKIYSVAHQLSMMAGPEVKSRTTAEGASQSFNTGDDSSSSTWLRMLEQIDKWGCTSSLFSSNNPTLFRCI